MADIEEVLGQLKAESVETEQISVIEHKSIPIIGTSPAICRQFGQKGADFDMSLFFWAAKRTKGCSKGDQDT